MSNVFFSWNTTKSAEGFEAIVYENTSSNVRFPNGSYCIRKTIKSQTFPTRAIAMARAKKWVLDFKYGRLSAN